MLPTAIARMRGLWNGSRSKFIPKKPVKNASGMKMMAIAVKRFIEAIFEVF